MNQMPPIARTAPQEARKGPSIIRMKSRPKKNLSFSNISAAQTSSQPLAATNDATVNKVKDVPQASFLPSSRSATPPCSSTPPLTPQTSTSPLTYQQQPASFSTAALAQLLTPTTPVVNAPTPPLMQSSVSSNGCSPSNDSADKKIDSRSLQPSAISYTFSWEKYLDIQPAEVAPKKAFMQSQDQLINLFMPGMKLEAKDPRNSASWCLAAVIQIHGLRLRLRFDGGDSMNDFYELIDSEHIRSYGSCPGSILLPPMAYKGNLATYSKFVEKQLFKPDVVIAPSNYFAPTPKKPDHNLFKTGMKLEAIDRKNPYLICPASVGEITGDDIKIVFDGWKGSFDYTCKYYSREIFPVNWCRDTNHSIAPPNGWDGLLEKKSPPPSKAFKSPTKEKLLLKVDLVPVKQNKGSPRIIFRKSDSSSKPEVLPYREIETSPAPKRAHVSPFQLVTDEILKRKEIALLKKVESSPPKRNDTTPAKKVEPSPPKRNDTTPAKKVESSPPKRIDTTPAKKVEPSPPKRNDTTPAKKVEPSPPKRNETTAKKNEASPSKRTDVTSCKEAIFCLTPEADSSTLLKKTNGTPISKVVDSSTRKSEKRKASDSPQVINEDPDESEEIDDKDRYQCARTRSFSDWMKTKASTVSSDNQPKKIKRDPSSYSVDEVAELIKSEDMEKYSEIFVNHEIDGKALLLLTSEMMINHMGLKVGPVLKIVDLIERERRRSRS